MWRIGVCALVMATFGLAGWVSSSVNRDVLLLVDCQRAAATQRISQRVVRWDTATVELTELDADVIPVVTASRLGATPAERRGSGTELSPVFGSQDDSTLQKDIVVHMPDGLRRPDGLLLEPDGLPDGNAPSSTLAGVPPPPLASGGGTSYSVPAYDPTLFPTVAEPRTSGPLGFWKRLTILSSIELAPDGPAEWWPQKQDSSYLMHNILRETEAYDSRFNRDAIRTESMRLWMHKLTNQLRREAIVKCAVAFEEFMQAHFPDAEWWLEGGSLIGAMRAPHRFIPWDEDADVTMMEGSWQSVVDLLKQEVHSDPQPNAEGARCGCLLVDMASFGSERRGFRGMNMIPGRVINECTGNYVDIFNAKPLDGSEKVVLSQQPLFKYAVYSWERSVVLPPVQCYLEGHPFKCPARPWEYLDVYPYGSTAKTPDHIWSDKYKTYE
jgi:hypothetical protein